MTAIGAALAFPATHHAAPTHHATSGVVHFHHPLSVVRVVGRSGGMLIASVGSGKNGLVLVIPVIIIRDQGGTEVAIPGTDQRVVIGFGLLVRGFHLLNGRSLVGRKLPGYLLPGTGRQD